MAASGEFLMAVDTDPIARETDGGMASGSGPLLGVDR
jgi:hypothetical protein